MEESRQKALDYVTEQTKAIMMILIQHNELDSSCMTEDGVWFTGSIAERIKAPDISEYLNKHAIHQPIGLPSFIIIQADEMGSDFLSVSGKVEYHSSYDDDSVIKVSFNADWIEKGEEWKLRKLITTSRKATDNPHVWNSDARIDNSIICDSMPVGLVCCTNDNLLSIQMMNSYAYEMLGFSSITEYKRSVGESVFAAIHPEDLPIFKNFITSIQEKSFAESEFFRMRKKDFSYLWVQFLGGLAEHEWLIFACIDHSEQMGITAELQQKHDEAIKKQDYYKDMIDSMPGGFHKCTLFEPIHMEYISDSLCELSGYTRKEIFEDFGGLYGHLVLEDDHSIISNVVERLMQYPHTEQIEYRMKRKDGTVLWVSETTRSVRDQNGKLWAYAAVQNIDEKHSRQVLFGNIAEDMPVGFATYRFTDGMLRLLYCNEAYIAESGYSRIQYTELVATDPFALVVTEDVPIIMQKLNDFVISGDVGKVEFDARINGAEGIVPVHYVAAAEKNGNEGYLVRVFQSLIDVPKVEVVPTPVPAPVQEVSVPVKEEPRVVIQTFGYFEVFVDGKPINFRTKKGREMLAFLVDRRGGFVTQSMIISTLWENEDANPTTLGRCRRIYKALVDELKEYGIDDIVESDHGARRIIPDKVKCDLFDYRSGLQEYQHLFKGNYMMDYSWSEMTLSELLHEWDG